jgi:hypothetical protein
MSEIASIDGAVVNADTSSPWRLNSWPLSVHLFVVGHLALCAGILAGLVLTEGSAAWVVGKGPSLVVRTIFFSAVLYVVWLRMRGKNARLTGIVAVLLLALCLLNGRLGIAGIAVAMLFYRLVSPRKASEFVSDFPRSAFAAMSVALLACVAAIPFVDNFALRVGLAVASGLLLRPSLQAYHRRLSLPDACKRIVGCLTFGVVVLELIFVFTSLHAVSPEPESPLYSQSGARLDYLDVLKAFNDRSLEPAEKLWTIQQAIERNQQTLSKLRRSSLAWDQMERPRIRTLDSYGIFLQRVEGVLLRVSSVQDAQLAEAAYKVALREYAQELNESSFSRVRLKWLAWDTRSVFDLATGEDDSMIELWNPKALVRQQNLWASSGSGSRPSTWYRESSMTRNVR